MKRTFGVIVAAVALLGACASTPEPVPPPTEAYDTAKTLRTQIEEFDLAQYAEAEFEAGENEFAAAEAAMETEEYAVATERLNVAIDSYTIVISEGFRAVAATRQAQATDEKARADSVRANVALADQYAEALAIYNQGLEAAGAGDNQEAAQLFENATILFANVYQETLTKRQQALDAIERVDDRIEDLGLQRETLEQEAREEEESNQ